MISKHLPRQQHHHEGRWVTLSMRELMEKHHIDWKECCDRFLENAPEHMRSDIGVDCFRQRDWEFVAYALPKVFGGSMPKAAILTITALIAKKLKINWG